MVAVDMGRVIFLVSDFKPVVSSLSIKIPGLPAKLKPDRGLGIFFMASTPVGSLAVPPPPPLLPPLLWCSLFLLFFLPNWGGSPLADIFFFFLLEDDDDAAAAAAAAAAEDPEGALPESPEEGVEKKDSILFLQGLF